MANLSRQTANSEPTLDELAAESQAFASSAALPPISSIEAHNAILALEASVTTVTVSCRLCGMGETSDMGVQPLVVKHHHTCPTQKMRRIMALSVSVPPNHIGAIAEYLATRWTGCGEHAGPTASDLLEILEDMP